MPRPRWNWQLQTKNAHAICSRWNMSPDRIWIRRCRQKNLPKHNCFAARAQLEKDRANLSYSVIRSPVSGVVVDREVDVGQTVAASLQTPTLFKIAQDLSKMQIDSNFAEADIGSIRVGQTVRFTVDAFPDRHFQGRSQTDTP